MHMQNTSHAVMAQRAELKNSLDDFPTPPWATRALIEHVVVGKSALSSMTCLEPACGRGHMSVTLALYFREVTSFDVFDYGFGGVADFLKSKHAPHSFDWVITNPPFRLGEEFIDRSMRIARCGIAMLSRTVFIESVGRYERLFRSDPPPVPSKHLTRCLRNRVQAIRQMFDTQTVCHQGNRHGRTLFLACVRASR